MTDIRPEPPPVYYATQDHVRAEVAQMESRLETVLHGIQRENQQRFTELDRTLAQARTELERTIGTNRAEMERNLRETEVRLLTYIQDENRVTRRWIGGLSIAVLTLVVTAAGVAVAFWYRLSALGA